MGKMRAAKSRARAKADGSSGSSKASGSGCTSACATPDPIASPRVERVGTYDLLNLAKTWDDDEDVRSRIRDQEAILLSYDEEIKKPVERYVEATLETIRVNRATLAPVCKLLANNDLLMPNIDRLIQTVDQAYRIGKHPRSYEHSYQMSWAFRRLLVKVKSFCYKPSPPEEPHLQKSEYSDMYCACEHYILIDICYIYKI